MSCSLCVTEYLAWAKREEGGRAGLGGGGGSGSQFVRCELRYVDVYSLDNLSILYNIYDER